MAEGKWTKGPWRWNMDDDGVGTLFGGEREAPKELADFWRKPLRERPQETRRESELKAEQVANLDLCAAAPDLYEALKDALAQLNEYERAQTGEIYNNLKINAALSRARGETA